MGPNRTPRREPQEEPAPRGIAGAGEPDGAGAGPASAAEDRGPPDHVRVRRLPGRGTAPDAGERPEQGAVPPTAAAAGTSLREARERRGLSLEAAAEQTRIPRRFLEALEAGGPPDALPDAPYDRYFARQYARYLSLDADRLATPYAAENHDEPLPLAPLEALREPPPRTGRASWAMLAAAAVVVLAVVAVRATSGPLPDRPSIDRLVPSPSPTGGAGAAPSPTPPPARAMVAVLRVTAPCWIEAVADGEVVRSGTFEPDRTLRVRARRTLTLTLGNAGGVGLTVNGRRVRTGELGEVARLSFRLERGRVVRA